MPWGKERVQLYFGEVPLGDSLEPIVDAEGFRAPVAAGREDRRAGELARITKCARIRSCSTSLARSLPPALRRVERCPPYPYNSTTEAHEARWSSQPSKLPFEPFAGFEGGFDSHSLPPYCFSYQ